MKLSRPKTLLVSPINSMTLRKISTPPTLESHSVEGTQDNMTGQLKLRTEASNLVFHLPAWKVQRIWFTQWVVLLQMMIKQSKICIKRPTVTFNLESKRIETTNGNSTQMPMFSDMVKRELRTVLLWPSMPRDTKTNSQKLPSLKRPLRTTEP